MLRKLLLIAFLPSFAQAYHMLDVLGGSGFVWTNYSSESSVLSSDKVTASTVDGIFMRESIFLGMRYSNYSPVADGFFVFGFEGTGTMARPTIDGKIKYTLKNSSGSTKGSYEQNVDSASAPAFSSLRGSVHLGLNMPVSNSFSYEFGILGGLSTGTGKASYSYNFSGAGGSSSGGPSGLGLHAALRLALQFIPTAAVVISTEYRIFGEFFGSYAWIPGLMSSGSYLSNSGHLFLLSVGYRFGFEPRPEKDVKPP